MEANTVCQRCGETYGYHRGLTCPDGTRFGFVPKKELTMSAAEFEADVERRHQYFDDCHPWEIKDSGGGIGHEEPREVILSDLRSLYQYGVEKPQKELTMADLRKDCFPKSYTWWAQPQPAPVVETKEGNLRDALAEVMPKQKGWCDHGVYIGKEEPTLIGETALLRKDGLTGGLLAQFDNLALGQGLTHTWTRFRNCDFVVEDECR